jgi:DNA polymerase elongation subunit (family B)
MNCIKSDRFYNNISKYSEDSAYTPDICTHISSAIAAYSRIAIHEFKMFAMRNSCSVIYSDTDSIYLDKALPKNCEFLNNKLGGLKVEIYNKPSIFLSPKCYAISIKDGNDKILLKGLPKIHSRKLTFNNFKEFLTTNKYSIKYHKPVHKVLNKLLVKSLDAEYTTTFPFNKRRKVYDNDNK